MHKPGHYSRTLRITSSQDYRHVFNTGQKVIGKNMVIYYRAGSELKCGVIVSRKVDKRAVYRNKARRKLREVFRLNKPEKPGQYILIARVAIKDTQYTDVEHEFCGLVQKLSS